MPSNTRDSQSSARPCAILAATLAAALLSTASSAQAQEISPLDVNGDLPTSLTLQIASLDFTQVRQEVRKTAFTVCRNAVRNGELEVLDIPWCARGANNRAMGQYRTALRAVEASGQTHAALLAIRVAGAN
jgi:hypothetical protein